MGGVVASASSCAAEKMGCISASQARSLSEKRRRGNPVTESDARSSNPRLAKLCSDILFGVNVLQIQMPIQYLIGFNEETKAEVVLAFDARSKDLYEVKKPASLKVNYYQTMVYLSQNHIFVMGGLDVEYAKISKSAQLWDPVQCTVEPLPDMLEEKYIAMGTYFQGRLYSFGGKTYPNKTDPNDLAESLRHCEYFDLQSLAWVKMPPMPRKRCTGYTLIFLNRIYVFGGKLVAFAPRPSMPQHPRPAPASFSGRRGDSAPRVHLRPQAQRAVRPGALGSCHLPQAGGLIPLWRPRLTEITAASTGERV